LLLSKSIRVNFLIKLSVAMATLLLLFSIILYKYFSYDLESEMQNSLIKQSRYLFDKFSNLEEELQKNHSLLKNTLKLDAHIRSIKDFHHIPMSITKKSIGDRVYLIGYFPYEFGNAKYLILKKDITTETAIQHKIFKSIIILNALMLIIIVIYAFIISEMLLSPIKYFADKLAKMNENILEPIDISNIPDEFKPLGHSINQLVLRIKSFLTYKKELFIGTAHEMKTPLAVIRAKNQLALIRKNPTIDECREAMRETIKAIDDMNKTVSSILEFGRAEGAQFEKVERIDIIEFIATKMEEYRLIAKENNKDIRYTLTPKHLEIDIQPLLLEQIIRNFIQNALRFSPENSTIKVTTFLRDGIFYLKIRDEGKGVDDDIDLFSPFKRSKESPGTGLGLFLVKSAADAIGATVELKNRKDKRGAVATLKLPICEDKREC